MVESLNQSFVPFGDAGVVASVVDGFTVSILTVSLPVLLRPELSETEQLTACVPSPKTETVYGLDEPLTVAGLLSTVQVGPPATPLVASETATETVIGEFVFHPFAPFAVW